MKPMINVALPKGRLGEKAYAIFEKAGRKELEKAPQKIFDMLFAGSDEARKVASSNLQKLKQAMGIDYRNVMK